MGKRAIGKSKKILITGLFSLISAFSLCIDYDNFHQIYAGILGIQGVICSFKYLLFVMLSLFLYLFIFKRVKLKVYKAVSVFITVLASYAGVAYPVVETMFPALNNSLMLSIILFFTGRFLFYYAVLETFIFVFCQIKEKSSRFELKISDRKIFMFSFILLIVCWLPYYVLRYPAGIESDASNQLSMFFGAQELTNRWPVFVSWFTGIIISSGKAVTGTMENGIFFYVLFQTIICISVLCYSIVYLRKRINNDLFPLLLLIVYAFVPLFPGYITSIIKDSPFSISILLFIILLDREFNCSSILNEIYIFACALFMCLFRNNGIYIVYFILGFGFILFFMKIGSIRGIIISLAGTAVLYLLFCNVLLPALNIKSELTAEALSVPFQQTARYVSMYDEEISDTEKEIINGVLDYDIIREEYNAQLSDPVKNTYNKDGDLGAYFKLWFEMFFRKPLLYVDSTASNIYGFFNVSSKMWNRLNCAFYTHCDINLYASYDRPLKPYADIFEDTYLSFLESNILTKWFCHCSFYIMLGICMFIYLVMKKDKKRLMIMMPVSVTILILFASPTYALNGLRYSLPVVYAIPFLVLLFFGSRKFDRNI